MKKTLRVLGVALVAGTLALFGAGSSAATESNPPAATMTVVWEMPSWSGPQTPTWPQKIVSSSKNAGLDVSVPECGYFQVDEYRYTTESDQAKVDYLIKNGVLTAPNNPPEPLIRWKLVNNGVCESETPTPTPSESSKTPTPTPTESTQTPTPTPSESSETPTPTPTDSTPAPTPSGSKTSPPPELPKTGIDLTIYGGLAALLLLLGGLAVGWTRLPTGSRAR